MAAQTEDTLKTLFSTLVVAGLLAVAPLAHAAPITYTLTIGSIGTGSVSGTITTDGTMGFLAPANVTDWTIALTPDPGTPFTLLGPLSGNNSGLATLGNGLFTTAAGLFFDFDNSGYALFQNPAPGSGVNYICFAGNGTLCGNFVGPAINDGTDVFGVNTKPEEATRVLIGTVGSTVPEPGSLGLLSLGLLGLGAIRRVRS